MDFYSNELLKLITCLSLSFNIFFFLSVPGPSFLDPFVGGHEIQHREDCGARLGETVLPLPPEGTWCGQMCDWQPKVNAGCHWHTSPRTKSDSQPFQMLRAQQRDCSSSNGVTASQTPSFSSVFSSRPVFSNQNKTSYMIASILQLSALVYKLLTSNTYFID